MNIMLKPNPSVDETEQLVVFSLDEQRYAVRLSTVERVVQAVAVAPLPKAPEIVLGIINVRGQIMPVLSLRKRFGLTERRIEPADHFIIARTSERTVALVVDTVGAIVSFATAQLVAAETILPGLEHVDGILKLPQGMIFVHDLDRFLSLDEVQALTEVMPATP